MTEFHALHFYPIPNHVHRPTPPHPTARPPPTQINRRKSNEESERQNIDIASAAKRMKVADPPHLQLATDHPSSPVQAEAKEEAQEEAREHNLSSLGEGDPLADPLPMPMRMDSFRVRERWMSERTTAVSFALDSTPPHIIPLELTPTLNRTRP